MKILTVCLLCLLVSVAAVAQVDVHGVVIDKDNNEPLAGASVMVKGADGKIRKFAATKADGKFAISVPSVDGCVLEVSMMSFARQTISLEGAKFPLTVALEPGTNVLQEVTVKADRIREQGDTVTYFVGGFAQAQDRSIGDVLKRMPGIDVEKSGQIKYQGEAINKFYIEGSDLLGGKYGIATNGISHEDVGAVEVLENHQPMQVLAGLSFSDKAAINLRLKNKAKAVWTVHGKAGGGYSWQPSGGIWDAELFAMAVMTKFQNITTFRTNNTGDDLSTQATDFFASQRGTDLNGYVGVSLPGVPYLSRRRTLFNRSALVSTNGLWKMGRGELKAQIDYTFNRITADAANVTTYFLPGGDHVIQESRRGTERSHSLSAKMIYELNRKTVFINNTLQTNLDWDDIRLTMNGSLPNRQEASLPDYYVGNEFKLIKRFSRNHLVTFRSKIEWESMPQTLSVSMPSDFVRQEVRDHAFYTNESATYAFMLGDATVSFEGGLRGYLRSLNTSNDLNVLNDLKDFKDLTNCINTNYLTVYATPKVEYWVRRVNFTLNAPLSFAGYHFDKAIANRSEAYFTPSLSVNWQPNKRVTMRVRGGAGRSPMELSRIYPGYVMTDYRSFRSGVDEFYTTTSQNLSATFSYRQTRTGVFGNAMVMQTWHHNPYTLVQQLYGDYVVYSYSTARSDGTMFIASGSLGKSLDFMRGSVKINGSFNRNGSRLISESREVNSVTRSWAAGIKLNGVPLHFMSFDYSLNLSSSRLDMGRNSASWLSGMKNQLMLNFMPASQWEWHIAGEHYRNELTAGDYKNVFLLDTKLVYKLSKSLELSAALNNICDQRTYNYTIYNQYTSFESQRLLRGREFLLSIALRK